MAEDFAVRMLAKTRQRALGEILGWAEEHVAPHVPAETMDALRAKVRHDLAVLHDTTRDMLGVVQQESTVNEQVLRLVQQMHRATIGPRR